MASDQLWIITVELLLLIITRLISASWYNRKILIVEDLVIWAMKLLNSNVFLQSNVFLDMQALQLDSLGSNHTRFALTLFFYAIYPAPGHWYPWNLC